MTTTPMPPDKKIFETLTEASEVPSDFDRRVAEALKTWESLEDSPHSIFNLSDTVVAEGLDDTVPWPTKPTLASPMSGYAEALAVLPDAVVLFDSDGIVKFWNGAAESLFGWSAIEVVGKPAPFLAAAQALEHAEILDAAGRDTPIRERVVSRRGKDGRSRALHLFTSPTTAGDVMMQFRVVAEAPVPVAVPASPKLEAMGRMLAAVSHDFNNVLAAIVGSADLLADRIAIHHPDREWVEVIRTAGRHASGLTRRLLQFVKPAPAKPNASDLSAIVEGLLPLVRALVPNGVRIRTHLEPNLPATGVDATSIEQLLLNLATNAGQAMPRGGALQIRTSAAVHEGQPQVILAVADSGPGLDDEAKARLFEPYFTTKEQGTGLGLAVVNEIVKHACGRIEVDSHPGLGCVVRVSLPALSPPAQFEGRGRTALVVDDDPSVREVMKRVLESVGFDTVEAANGDEAMLTLRWAGAEPDLVVSDVVMPNIGGRKLVEKLREEDPDLAVVFVSGYPPVPTESAPRTAFLAKPFNAKQLLEAVATVMKVARRPAGE